MKTNVVILFFIFLNDFPYGRCKKYYIVEEIMLWFKLDATPPRCRSLTYHYKMQKVISSTEC